MSKKLLSIYCSGSIKKGSADDKKLCWSGAERTDVAAGAAPHELVFLNPDDPIPDPGNTLGQFGRDMYQVMIADAVVADARERRGLGVGIEIAAAKAFGTPIIVVAARNSKYRQDVLEYRGVTVKDYVHPHLASLAKAVVDDFTQAGKVLAKLPPGNRAPAKIPDWLQPAIDEYRDNLLAKDPPMQEALQRLSRLRE